MFKKILFLLFTVMVTLAAARHHNNDDIYDDAFDIKVQNSNQDYPESLVKVYMEANRRIAVQGISIECTYKCSKWNYCMINGAWNGSTAECGEEPSGCQCVW